ncbi:MAG TPA: hypothetical protein PKD72_04425 [Gemmatales bacterium]|nr:hypothetical protein [Gemmatales bacterium]
MRLCIILLCVLMSLPGCGPNKGTQKGTDDQLKSLPTQVGSTGAPLPPAATAAAAKGDPGSKMGTPGKAGGSKAGPPPPPPG